MLMLNFQASVHAKAHVQVKVKFQDQVKVMLRLSATAQVNL